MRLSGDRAVALGLTLVGVIAIALASQFREGTSTGGPGTRFFPILLGLVVVGLGMSLALRPAGASGAGESLPPRAALRVAGTLGALVLYVLAFGRVGFILATAPLLAVLLLLYGERRWPVVLTVAVGATGATYTLFGVWLGVPLPPGPLGW